MKYFIKYDPRVWGDSSSGEAYACIRYKGKITGYTANAVCSPSEWKAPLVQMQNL